MKVEVFVTLKNGVLDPQGKAVCEALHTMGNNNVSDVRQGKYFELEIEPKAGVELKDQVKAIAEKVLANTVIENFRFEVK
ncbi:phosphoribosylformylglycinamidine synthase subunit PurS [bacterium]|nr:phosphoribosylformylglycinamidine synthase subunit PurS [bacterium]